MGDGRDCLLLCETRTAGSERSNGPRSLCDPPLCRLSSEIVGDKEGLKMSSWPAVAWTL